MRVLDLVGNRLAVSEHLNDESLEMYSLGRVRGEERAAIEQHLVGCEQCSKRLTRLDEYTSAWRDVVKEFPGKF